MLNSEEVEITTAKSLVERVIFEANVKCKPSSGTAFTGVCSNLSVGGLYLRTKKHFDVEDPLTLTFTLPCREKEIVISCNARVAWTNFDSNRLKPDYVSGVGVQFLGLSKDDIFTLSRFIVTYDDEKKMNVVCAWCGNFLGMRKGPFGTTSHGVCNQCIENLKG